MTATMKNKMNCDVILTFDKMYDDEKQARFNFDIEVKETDTDLRNFIVNQLFRQIAKKFEAKRFVNEKEWLAIVSTCCDWDVYKRVTGNNDSTELRNGKWNFAECNKRKLHSASTAYELKRKYCFGTYTDNSWFCDNVDNDSATANGAYLEYLCENSGITLGAA
jgi:hypothetical protein